MDELSYLPAEVRQVDSLDIFKQFLSRERGRLPKYFYSGNRRGQLLHTRIRTNCSNLNNDLFLKHITDSPLCLCGNIENANHYFFVCPLYAHQRTILLNSISQYHNHLTLDILLFGEASLPGDDNKLIFETVQKYIIDTKRF